MIDDQDQDHDTAQDHGPDYQEYPCGYDDGKWSGWHPKSVPGAVYSHPCLQDQQTSTPGLWVWKSPNEAARFNMSNQTD